MSPGRQAAGPERPTTLRALAALVVAGLVAVAAACGSGATVESGAPGFEGRERQVDRSPFELANPTTTQGPTTIPGGPTLYLPTTTDPVTGESAPVGEPAPSVARAGGSGGRQREVARGRDVPSRPRPSAPTTTNVPFPEAPFEADGFCGASRYLQSLVTVFLNPSLSAPVIAPVAEARLARYQAEAPPQVQPHLDIVLATVFQLIREFRDGGFSPEFRTRIDPLIARAPEWTPFLEAFDRLLIAEVALCPDVPMSLRPAR